MRSERGVYSVYTIKKIIEITIIAVITLISISPTFRRCVFYLFGVIYSKLIGYPFFSGVMISWGVAVFSTFIVLLFAYFNHDKKKQQYKEIFRQSEKWLRRITIFVLFYIGIHLASKAFWKIGIPKLGETYVAYYISPQDVFLSCFVFFIIISLFLIAPYVIDRYKNIVRILLSISLVLSILIALCIPSFVPVIAPPTEPPQMPGSYLFSLNAGLEDNLSKGVISEELNNSFKTAGFSLSDNATVKKEKENEWVITDKEKFIVRKEDDVYLFSWDNVPGNDNETLIRFLRDDLDMDWVENAEISKFDDGKTIFITKDENSAEIMIDEKEGKAPLKIGNYDLKVKKENGKLNIYEAGKLNVYRGERDLPVYWFFIIFVFFSIVSLLIYKFMGIPKGIKSDFRDLLLVFCFMPAIIVASLLLAGDELVIFSNLPGNIVVGLLLISGFAALMSIVTISFKQETVSPPWRNPVWLCSTFASLAFISLFSMVFLLLRDFLKIDIDIFGKALSFSVAIMILILLYGFLYEKLQKYRFTEWWRREYRPIAIIISILLIAIVSAIDPEDTLWLWRWEIPSKLFWIAAVLVIGFCLPWILGLWRFWKHIEPLKPIEFELLLPNLRYLFIWDNVPVNHSERLLRYLKVDCNIDWAENAEICKSDDGKTIRISKDGNSAEIIIDEKEKKATLRISDGRTLDLNGKMKNGKLIIRRHIPKKPLRFKLPKLLFKLSKLLPKYQGMVLVKVETGPDKLKEVVKELDGIEGVYQTMVVKGEYDVCLTVEGVSFEDIEGKILEIRKAKGVASTTMLMDIREFFDREVR